MHSESPQAVAPDTAMRGRGLLILLVVFTMSACATVFYLSNVTAATTAQAAAAAEIRPSAFDNISLLAQAAYVVDLSSGAVLYEKNVDVQLPLASLTKVAMALAVSEVLPADSSIRIPYDTSPPGSAEHLGKGDVWKVRDVINFTLIASSNGGANILADAADEKLRAKYPEAPVGAATLWRMNDIAKNLGLTNTYFLNVHGLDISATQAGAYGSARDVAKLFAYVAEHNASVFGGTTADGMLISAMSGAHTSAFNTNKALGSIPGLVMGKTGLTDLAGGNLAIVFNVGPLHPIVAVVLHSTEDGRFEDMKKIVAASITETAK